MESEATTEVVDLVEVRKFVMDMFANNTIRPASMARGIQLKKSNTLLSGTFGIRLAKRIIITYGNNFKIWRESNHKRFH